ncbi:MAG: ATP-binding protein [Eubacterium sp.]|nr:ATP-binding protein [Eubacterium sp.]
MVIERQRYLDKLISHMNNGLIKVITGIRRCGKSYLLFEIFYNYLIGQGIPKENIIAVSLDDVEYFEYTDPHKLNDYIKSRLTDSNQNYYVFIDEAQYAITKEEMKNPDVPIRLYGVLNGLLRKKNVDVYVTGSNSKFLSSDIMTEFRGRGDEIHIAPLSFSEYLPVAGKDKPDAWQDYTYYGGLPHVLAEPDAQSKTAYLERLNKEIYLRDICDRYDIKDGSGMEELMKLLASSIGSLTNPQKVSDTFTSSGRKWISMPTITNYLKYLQESFMVQKVERYDIKGRKYISTPSKYYYTDIGLRNAFLNFRQYEETHIMENIIYNELIYRGYNVDVGVVEIRVDENGKRIKKQLEVDFVVNQGSKRFYIQSALSIADPNKKEQEIKSLKRIPDSFSKIVVVRDYLKPWQDENGITYVGLEQFLLDEDILR